MAVNKNLVMTDTGSNRRSSTGIPLVGTKTASGSYQSAKTAAGGKAAAVAAGKITTGTNTPVTVANVQTNVHPDYRGIVLDAISGDPRDLPQVGSDALSPYTVAYSGFPKADGEDNGTNYSAGGGGGRRNYYEAATLRPATSQADYINAMYKANEERHRAALEAQYDANVATLDRQAAAIAPQYQQAANAAAAQSAVAQAAFNERAAAAGMNTGAGSQAALAQNNTLLSGISAIRQAESEALADVEAQRVSLAQQYQKAIADAVANNEAAKAQALYNEAVRVDESLVSTAANQATENYRAWQARYG